MIEGLKPYPEYRESGFGGADAIPCHWSESRLRHVCKMLVSSVDKHFRPGELPVRLCNYVDVYKNERIHSHLRFVPASASSEEVERFRIRIHDVIVTKDSESWNDIGVPSLVECEAPDLVCGYHLAILRPRLAQLVGGYLLRALQCPTVSFQCHVEAHGVTRFGLSHGAIRNINIPIPPPDEQAAIVCFLDHATRKIDRAIRVKRKLIALLNEQKQAIIQRAVTRGLDPAVPLKPSGVPWLGEIPEHWEVARSRRLFSACKELARPDDVQLSATQAFGVIPQEEFEHRVGRRVVKISMHLERRKHVEPDDFVISMRSFQGGLERAWARGAIRSSYVVLRPKPEVDVPFFSYLLKSHGYIKALQATANFIRDGQDLTEQNFRRVDLPLIPLPEQRAIADHIKREAEATANQATLLEREIALLREFRTRLVADVVTGKLDVREAARNLPEEVEPLPDGEEADEDLGDEADLEEEDP